jgi:hypothetical protein
MSNDQNLQEFKQFTHQAFAKIEGHIDYLVAEFNIIEEEKLPSQLMAQGHYMMMRMMLAILVMSMSLTPSYSRVRKLWITMRRKRKRSMWSLLST